jgi:hypothetical protein
MNCRRLLALVPLLVVCMVSAACDGGRTGTALSPSPTPSAPLPAVTGGTLSGVVFETTATGWLPIANVEVYCDACGPQGHTLSFTGSDGGYVLAGAPAGPTLVLVAKQGYALPKPDLILPNPSELSWLGGINVRVIGDTRFDIELLRR